MSKKNPAGAGADQAVPRQTGPGAPVCGRLHVTPHVGGFWDPSIEGYFRAEIQENADGTAQSLTSASAIAQALDGVQAEEWADLVREVRQPVLLLNATGEYGPPGSPPVVPAEHALATARAFADCRYVEIPGNHLTMVFGESAALVRHEMEAFIDRDSENDTGR